MCDPLRRCLSLVLVLVGWAFPVHGAHGESTAFYYGGELPDELLRVYDRVVVEPDALPRSGRPSPTATTHRARLWAYVSVGELARGTRPAAFQDDWVLGSNPAWHSDVMDLTHAGWRRYLLDTRMAALWKQGYRGFFLDTLDSYRIPTGSEAKKAAQKTALVSLIREMSRRFPGVELIGNRGFELLPDIAPLLRGVAAESLYDRWDAAKKRYVQVPEADRRWLLARLREVRDRYRLPVTVIDYRPPEERPQARETARKIAAHGFEPWVTNADLTAVGVGNLEILPRRVLVLYDGKSAAPDPLAAAPALRLLAPILEYKGYVPEFHDVRRPLPEEPLMGRYAGIATWFTGDLGPDGERYCRWLLARIRAGVRVAIFGEIGFFPPRTVQRRLGIRLAERRAPGRTLGKNAVTVSASPWIGFEAAPQPHRVLGPGFIAGSSTVATHLRVADDIGPLRDPVMTLPWGGMALAPHLLHQGHGGELSWVIDPFVFIDKALALEPLPAADLTTEFGRRLLMVHVDAEGQQRPAEQRGTPRTGEVLWRILGRHRLPHSTTLAKSARRPAHVVIRAAPLVGPGADLTRTRPSLTHLQAGARPSRSPAGRNATAGARLDIHWPVADEAGFRGPGSNALGYRRVIETFQLTDARRRLKPIAVHYHAYTAATAAGRKALEAVYRWVKSQPTRPIYAWEYADKVRDFHRLVITRRIDDRSLELFGLDKLRTLRIPAALGWPDLSRSADVVAVAELPQGRYVSFLSTPSTRFSLGASRPVRPMITASNADVLQFSIESSSRQRLVIRLRLRGHVPVSFELGNLPRSRCVIVGRGYRRNGQIAEKSPFPTTFRFDTLVLDTGMATVTCKST